MDGCFSEALKLHASRYLKENRHFHPHWNTLYKTHSISHSRRARNVVNSLSAI